MSCEGFGEAGFKLGGPCTISWLAIAVIFFVALILRRQCEDGMLSGTQFNFLASLILGLGSAVVTVTLFATPKIALVVGLVGVLVGGFVIGSLTGGGSNEE